MELLLSDGGVMKSEKFMCTCGSPGLLLMPPVSAVEGKLVSTRVHTTPGSLQRSRSDIDVNAASNAKSRLSTVPASSPFSSAAALPPGSYASLGNPPIIRLSDQRTSVWSTPFRDSGRVEVPAGGRMNS